MAVVPIYNSAGSASCTCSGTTALSDFLCWLPQQLSTVHDQTTWASIITTLPSYHRLRFGGKRWCEQKVRQKKTTPKQARQKKRGRGKYTTENYTADNFWTGHVLKYPPNSPLKKNNKKKAAVDMLKKNIQLLNWVCTLNPWNSPLKKKNEKKKQR